MSFVNDKWYIADMGRQHLETPEGMWRPIRGLGLRDLPELAAFADFGAALRHCLKRWEESRRQAYTLPTQLFAQLSAMPNFHGEGERGELTSLGVETILLEDGARAAP